MPGRAAAMHGWWRSGGTMNAVVACALAVAMGQPPVRQPPPPLPADAQLYRVLTDAYAARRVDDYDRAVIGFARALELAPARSDVRKDLAYTYFRVGDNERARRQFAEVVRRDSADVWAALELAFLDY